MTYRGQEKTRGTEIYYNVSGKNHSQGKSIDEVNSSIREYRTELKLILIKITEQSQLLQSQMIIIEIDLMNF